ncbi:MAG: helix-turn-helix transcriptional regulator [Solirubrobacterales bacterium]|nr:helix-turn-helix transcriptional regulator [Solirubrobacterales bacterium]
MDIGSTLYAARRRAGLSQTELARATGTSQSAISAYESGAKQPALETVCRLLAASGYELTARRARRSHPIEPSARQLAHVARQLIDVIALAEALPVRHDRALRYPRLAALGDAP